MAKLHFSFHDLVIAEATILVVDFTASSSLVLRPSYGFVYMTVRLNVPELLLDKYVNNFNEIKKVIYLIELFRSESHCTIFLNVNK